MFTQCKCKLQLSGMGLGCTCSIDRPMSTPIGKPVYRWDVKVKKHIMHCQIQEVLFIVQNSMLASSTQKKGDSRPSKMYCSLFMFRTLYSRASDRRMVTADLPGRSRSSCCPLGTVSSSHSARSRSACFLCCLREL